jgi:phosphoserine phosphatase
MKKNLVITLSDKYIGRIKEIAKMLSNDGLVVTNVYDFGVITGTTEEINVDKIKKHKEIEALTEELNISISPPDSELQ